MFVVMKCSQYGNGVRMHVILLHGEPLEQVDCFKYLRSHVAADGRCEKDVVHKMKEGYRAWGALKSVQDKSKVFYGQELPSGESTTT